MPRTIDSANQAALEASSLVSRDFLYIFARNRTTLEIEEVGFWSDEYPTSVYVQDPEEGDVLRAFYGAGGLIKISDIPLVAHVSVQEVNIEVSQIDELVEQAIREYDCQQAAVHIYRGLYDPISRNMVAPAECRWFGFIDYIDIPTPAEGDEDNIVITCTSHTQEATRANPDVRSHESQIAKFEGDAFYKDTSVVGEWEFFWGSKSGKLPTAKK